MPQKIATTQKKKLHFSLIVFLVCMLFTVMLWDHYLNSEFQFDRQIASYAVLVAGTLFSLASGLFASSIEGKRDRLEKEIKNLQGLIPICAQCKKIRNVEGSWEQLEMYIQRHSEATFSHGYCGHCLQALKAKRG